MQQTLIGMTSDPADGIGSQNLAYVWERNNVLKLACGSDIPFTLQCKSHKVSLCLKNIQHHDRLIEHEEKTTYSGMFACQGFVANVLLQN